MERDFPNDEAVLDFLFDAQHSRKCSCGGHYTLKTGRRQFQCSKCRFQIAPTANTLFHKSDTPLTLWFKAILTFSNAKSGISAKEMERQLEVTYKTAWRIKKMLLCNTINATIHICLTKNKKTKKDLQNGIKKIKKEKENTTGNTAIKTLKDLETPKDLKDKNCDLRFYIGTAKEYRNALAVEKQKSGFYLLTT